MRFPPLIKSLFLCIGILFLAGCYLLVVVVAFAIYLVTLGYVDLSDKLSLFGEK